MCICTCTCRHMCTCTYACQSSFSRPFSHEAMSPSIIVSPLKMWVVSTTYSRAGVAFRPSQRNAAISANVQPPTKQTSATGAAAAAAAAPATPSGAPSDATLPSAGDVEAAAAAAGAAAAAEAPAAARLALAGAEEGAGCRVQDEDAAGGGCL